MDRLIHTVSSALVNLRDTQGITAQNLANQSVPGYRRDVVSGGATVYLEQAGAVGARAFQRPANETAFSTEAGFLDQTGEPLDVAIADEGYFYIQPDSGGPALSRRGDLRVALDGRLLNGAGEPVLDSAMAPITLPPFRNVVVDDLGTITIEPLEGAPGERLTVATIATVVPGADVALTKGSDGQIRTPLGTVPAANQGARVMQGVLERSNVNPTEELLASIDQQRGFELNMRLISEAKTLDEAGNRLLGLPES